MDRGRLLLNAHGVFDVALCAICQTMRTHHRCLAEVAFGGRLLGSEGGQLVCGEPVCGPCSAKFGNEGVTRCQQHSGSTSDSETTLEEKRSAVKSRNGLVATARA
jgi:hypothetical protein